MKHSKPSRFVSLFLSMLAVIALFPTQSAHAAGSNVSVSPTTQSVQRGQSFTIQLRGYISSDFLGASRVAGGLTFPSNLLQVTDVNTNAATLNWQKTHSIGSGVVNFDQRAFFPVDNTNIAIGSVTFRTLASGTAVVGFTSGTAFSNNSATVATGRGTGTYTITTPPSPTCPAGQVGTPPNCTTPPTPNNPKPTQPQNPSPTPQTPSPTTPTTPTPSPDITEEVTGEADKDEDGFSISDVTATRGYDSALLNWKISGTSKATVAYGTSLKDLSKTVDATQKPDGSYEAELIDLTPGKQYYYTISATADADAAKTDSYSGVFTARGFPVIISITEDKSPATNAKIKIGEQNYSTDKNGRISLELASGSYTAEIKTSKGTKSFTLAVAKKPLPKNGNTPEIQKFTFDIQASTATAPSNNDFLLLIGGLVAGVLLIGGLLFWLWRRRQNQDQQPTTIVSGDNDYAWAQSQTSTNSYSSPAAASFPATADINSPVPSTQDNYIPGPTAPYGTQPEMSPALAEQEGQPAASLDPTVIEPAASEYTTPLPVEESFAPANSSIPAAPADDYQVTQEDLATSASTVADDSSYSDDTATTLYSESTPDPTVVNQSENLTPAAQVIETPSGSELQINHEDRHNSVYINEEEPKDMFDTAKN